MPLRTLLRKPPLGPPKPLPGPPGPPRYSLLAPPVRLFRVLEYIYIYIYIYIYRERERQRSIDRIIVMLKSFGRDLGGQNLPKTYPPPNKKNINKK